MSGHVALTANQRFGGLPPQLADFLEHWLSLSSDGLVTSLESFLGRPDPRFQAMTSIIDITGLQSMSIRLFGTGLVDLLGRDFTGSNATQWYSEQARGEMGEFTARMLAAPYGLACLRAYVTSKGRRVNSVSLSLPLRRASGVISSMVVFFVMSESLGPGEVSIDLSDIAEPRWIDIGFGVPEFAADHYLKQRRKIGSSISRFGLDVLNGVSSLVRRMGARARLSGLFTSTGDREITAFFDHWSDLRGSNQVPHLRAFLDHPAPAFQPYVTIIDVDSSGRTSVRLMGGERFDLAARPTSQAEPMRVVYSPRLYPKLHAVTVACVSRPCGFRAIRSFESTDGQKHRAAVIALPLVVDDPRVKSFVHYQFLLGSKAYRGAAQVVTAIHSPQWIDIGAGVPEPLDPRL